MLRKILVAVAVALICPACIFAQDLSFLFGGNIPEAGGTPTSNTQTIADPTITTGTINIFAAPNFGFDAADLFFFSSDTSVAQITGGTAINPTTIFGYRFDSTVVTVPTFDNVGSPVTPGSTGNLFSLAILATGIDPAFSPFDPTFDATDGFLLATIDYDIVGQGTTEFSLSLQDANGNPAQGIVNLPGIGTYEAPRDLNPTFGSATLTVVPEPSSAILLIMGSVAMVTRRKRA